MSKFHPFFSKSIFFSMRFLHLRIVIFNFIENSFVVVLKIQCQKFQLGTTLIKTYVKMCVLAFRCKTVQIINNFILLKCDLRTQSMSIKLSKRIFFTVHSILSNVIRRYLGLPCFYLYFEYIASPLLCMQLFSEFQTEISISIGKYKNYRDKTRQDKNRCKQTKKKLVLLWKIWPNGHAMLYNS